jgi:predicted glycoside hydrolase/deacetylase ChbG (UPF0249 family)
MDNNAFHESKKIIITADDLGIAREINKGIIESYKNGITTSSALLMNAPYTEEGVEIASENPDLEVGIHLSIVEGISLRGKKSTITDDLRYFDNKLCLIKDWKSFLKLYFLGRINFSELEEELELQIIKFLKHFKNIPFINGTQHMHILPKVWKIIIRLCLKYNIKAVRLPSLEKPSLLWFNKRLPFLIPFQFLGEKARRDLKKTHVKSPNGALGMQYSGKISETVLLKILKNLPNKIVEIVMHPGYESPMLRKRLPWSYTNFDWDTERQALQSEKVKKFLEMHNIKLCRFYDL